MRRFLVRIEAVNLSSSIFDTQDLSTIRGGSFACLDLPQVLIRAVPALRRREVFSGASQAVALLDVEDDTDQTLLEGKIARLAAGGEGIEGLSLGLAAALPHVQILGVAVPFDGDFQQASASAVARLRRRQLAQPSIDLGERPGVGSRRPCQVDGARPAITEVTKGDKRLHISRSVAVRRRIGIEGRSRVYGREIGDALEGVAFVDSFLELTADAPRGLPPSLSGKMAVIKLDGNKFTRSRNDWISKAHDPGEAAGVFSDKVVAARRRFLSALLEMVRDDPKMRTSDGKLRFETLMWGGDESLFVLPAWKVRDLLDVIASDMSSESWSLGSGIRLTTAYGVLICSAKMPISIAKSLVESLLDSAKALNGGGTRDRLTLQIIESIEAPTGDVRGLRRQLYETDADGAFTLSGHADVERYLSVCDRVTDPQRGLPRSQLQWLLSQKGEGKLPTSRDAGHELLELAVRRSRQGGNPAEVEEEVNSLLAALRDDVLGRAAGFPYLPYQRLAELWDLLRPFPALSVVEQD